MYSDSNQLNGGEKKTKLIVEIIKSSLNFLEKGRQEEESYIKEKWPLISSSTIKKKEKSRC